MDITRGQRWSIKSSTVDVTFNLDLDAGSQLAIAVLFLDAVGKAVGSPVAIGHDSHDGMLAALPDRPHATRVHLAHLSTDTARLLFVVARNDSPRLSDPLLDNIRGGQLLLHDGSEVHHLRLDGSELATSHSAVVLELYRKEGWRAWFRAAGLPRTDEGPLHDYGIPSTVWPPALKPSYPASPAQRRNASPATPQGTNPILPAGVPIRLPGMRSPLLSGSLPASLPPAVTLLEVTTPTGPATGTAFYITPGGLAITCAHVVQDATEIALRDGGDRPPRHARLHALDTTGDLALISPDDYNGVLHWLELAPPESSRGLGTEVGLLGYPLGSALGLNLTYSQGVVNSCRQKGGITILQIDAGAAPGSSGGPVFQRSDGRVIGVLTSGLQNGPPGMLVNFALDLAYAWDLGWFTKQP